MEFHWSCSLVQVCFWQFSLGSVQYKKRQADLLACKGRLATSAFAGSRCCDKGLHQDSTNQGALQIWVLMVSICTQQEVQTHAPLPETQREVAPRVSEKMDYEVWWNAVKSKRPRGNLVSQGFPNVSPIVSCFGPSVTIGFWIPRWLSLWFPFKAAPKTHPRQNKRSLKSPAKPKGGQPNLPMSLGEQVWLFVGFLDTSCFLIGLRINSLRT